MRIRVPAPKRQFAKALRATSADAEAKLWRLLRSRRLAHLKFRRQVPIGPWIVDFVCFEDRSIVEADGSQHVESVRDRQHDDDLKEGGFTILRVWNNDILARTDAVAEAIFAAASPSPGAHKRATLSHEGRGTPRRTDTPTPPRRGRRDAGTVETLPEMKPSPRMAEGGRRRRPGEGGASNREQGLHDGR